MSRGSVAICLAAALAIAGCASEQQQDSYRNPKVDPQPASSGSVLDNILGAPKPAASAAVSIGVNSYLWRASLDTMSFMPIASADPFGGVIITDWYSPPATPTERFKVNVFILGRELRSDGLRAAVFHQRRTADGSWIDASVDPKTQTDLENAILTRARELRINTAQK